MRALVLTLPEQPERGERAKSHITERLPGVQLEMVTGIHGQSTGLVSTHFYEHDHPGSKYVIGPCTIGIWLSHYIAWSIVEHGSDPHVIIFEDDVLLDENATNRITMALADAPSDFDMLFLGSCCCEGHIMGSAIKGDVFNVQWPQCLHAYVLARKAAAVLTRSYRDVYGPIDCLLRLTNFSGLKVYTVLPRCAGQVNTELPK